MFRQKKLRIFFALAAFAAFAACEQQSEQPKKVDKLSSERNSAFTLSGAYADGEYLSLGDENGVGANLADNKKTPYTLIFQIGASGKVNNLPWRAIGITVTTPHVYVRQGDGPLDASDDLKATTYVKGGKEIVAILPSGKEIVIGKPTKVSRAYPIKLESNVQVKLAIGAKGAPFDPKIHSKETPDDQRFLWVIVK